MKITSEALKSPESEIKRKFLSVQVTHMKDAYVL